ncbi:MAG: ISL3 family transposase [Chloroflexi bacterium]|nr:ISL3 family transposase [Chloroflexota bacterium]
MFVTAVLPPDSGLVVEGVSADAERVIVRLAGTRQTAACPACGVVTGRVHAAYTRTLTDLPCHGLAVVLRVRVRRFRCGRAGCPRRTFAERLDGLAAPRARRSRRLGALHVAIGLALGGEGGARLAAEVGVPISADTLLRAITAAPLPAAPTPRVLGVDDWCWRRGHRYGTILIDHERRRVVDLLPDRTADGLARWLAAHPGVELVTRDRAGAYADGIRRGAPDAVQIADRFHVVKNVGEALARVLQRHHRRLTAAAKAVDDARRAAEPAPPVVPPPPRPPTARQAAVQAARERRMALYTEVRALHARGLSQRAVARQLGVSRATVAKFVAGEVCLERALYPPRAPQPTTILTPYEPYLRERWAAGCHNAWRLWEEIRAMGFAGSRSLVRLRLAAWRTEPGRGGRPAPGAAEPGPPARPTARALSPRQARWLLVAPVDEVEPAHLAVLDHLCRHCPDVPIAQRLTLAFGRLVRERDVAAFATWLADATASGVAEFRELAAGIARDRVAIEAALRHEWSNGRTEAHVLQLKAVRRQMRGRGGFELLRRRVIKAA